MGVVTGSNPCTSLSLNVGVLRYLGLTELADFTIEARKCILIIIITREFQDINPTI